jgi:outer membrane protein
VFRHILVLVLATAAGFAEIHSLTLRQAVEIALKENPDLVLARLDEQKAQQSVRIAKDPFVPKLYAGSGAAKVWGYPSSIEGAAPSIVQTRTDMSLFNQPKKYELARSRENARTAAIATQSKSDEIAYQTASLFLDAQQVLRNIQSLKPETESLERVSQAVKLRVDEGRALPIENKRLAVDLARARQRYEAATDDLEYAQASLAVVLGYPAGDRVQPVDEERAAPEIPAT